MGGIEADVERVKHGLRKPAQDLIPRIYNDALVDTAITQVKNETVAIRLPMFQLLDTVLLLLGFIS